MVDGQPDGYDITLTATDTLEGQCQEVLLLRQTGPCQG